MRPLPLLALVLVTPQLIAQTVPAPTARITLPGAGLVDAELVVPFEATVTPATIQTAMLTVNGASYEVPVSGGRVRQQVIGVPGNNRVALTVAENGRTAVDSTTFHLRGERAELMVLLAWPSEGEIIDLWVREPDGQTCKWDHRRTTSGGRLLDFSANAIGFGSQAYVSPQVHAGRYRVKVHYWSARGRGDERGAWTWREAIHALDDVESRLVGAVGDARRALVEQRGVLEARLDRWASPGAPQTRVRAEVVLFPNTTAERRWRFERDVERTGQLLTLGDVVIEDTLIARGRRAIESESAR
ncbi:MAG: hypothetical protein R3A48_11030 [Polyangiales bacterium]